MELTDRMLFEEMGSWSPARFVSEKAERVHDMCLDHGHFAWARAIRYRYSVAIKSDLVMSFGIALFATIKNNNNGTNK